MADKNEKIQRINKVYSMLLVGIKRRDVVLWAQKNYNISEKQAYTYVKEAIELREEDSKEYRLNAISDQIASLRNLYLKNYKIEDYKECRAILAQISQLLGLNEPIKSNINVTEPITYIKREVVDVNETSNKDT